MVGYDDYDHDDSFDPAGEYARGYTDGLAEEYDNTGCREYRTGYLHGLADSSAVA